MKTLIYTGGTFSYVRNHLALSAPAFGTTGRVLAKMIPFNTLIETKMANVASGIVTNDDLKADLIQRLKDPEVKCVIMNAALCDFDGKIGDIVSGKHSTRLESRETAPVIVLTPADKVISSIKQLRPDVLVVGFKTTCNAQDHEIDFKAERMIKTGIDIVVANDTGRRVNALYYSQKAKKVGNTKAPIPNRHTILKVLVKNISKLLELENGPNKH